MLIKKTIKALFFCIIFIAFIINGYSQLDTTSLEKDTIYNKYSKPSIILGPSFFSYAGELNGNNQIPFATNFDLGLTAGVEYRWKKFYGLNLLGHFGSIHQNERELPLRNFKSSFYNIQLNNIFYFDNDFLLKHERGFAPILTLGIGLTMFEPMSDLKDKDGLQYFYWNDGTLRDRPRDPDNPHEGQILNRDYDFETKIDSSGKLPTMTLSIPVGVGLRYKLSEFFELTFLFSYNFTTTDYLDGYLDEAMGKGIFKGNDAFFYTGITIQYNIGAKPFQDPSEKIYADVDFSELEKKDSDGDGVSDNKDKCPDTPQEAKVDANGCPKDTDGDGVPDYRDVEPNSVTGVQVDANGATITEKMLYEMYQLDSMLTLGFYPDSLKHRARRDTVTRVSFKDIVDYEVPNPSKKNTAVTPVQNNIPEKYITAGAGVNEVKENSVSDLFYTVQIAYSEVLVEDEYFYNKYELTDNVYVVQKQGYKYYVGNFPDKQKAQEFATKIKKNNRVGDAFVTQIPAGMVLKSLTVPENLKSKPVALNPNNIPEIKEISEDQKGLFYRIQISSRATKLPPEYFLEKYNITDEVFVSLQDGSYKYSIGKFEKYEEAKKFNDDFKQNFGIMDSYITPYLDGKRISVPEAMKVQNQK